MNLARRLVVILQTIVGTALLGGSLILIDCAHRAQTTPNAPNALTSCKAPLPFAPMLCNRVRDDAECAICPDPDRACLTATHIYCVAAGCDDPACGARP